MWREFSVLQQTAKPMKKKRLTKAEEEIMQIIWDKEPCVTGDVIRGLEQRLGKKPAHSTVSTMLRILVEKGFLQFKALSRHTRIYTTCLQREDYLKQKVQRLAEDYFDNSIGRLVSFLVKEKFPDNEKLARLAAMLEEE